MKQTMALATMLLIFPATMLAGASSSAPSRDSHRASRIQYVRHTFGAQSVARSTAAAGIGQARNVPHEWGQGGAGFAKRLGSAFGQHVVANTIHFGVSSLRHEEVGYRPSGKTGFGPRMKYALMSTVVTRKTTTGKRTVAAGEISGAFGSGMISRVWQPASTRTIGSGVASGGVMLGVDASTHVVREFWPEIRHPGSHRTANSRPAAKRRAS